MPKMLAAGQNCFYSIFLLNFMPTWLDKTGCTPSTDVQFSIFCLCRVQCFDTASFGK